MLFLFKTIYLLFVITASMAMFIRSLLIQASHMTSLSCTSPMRAAIAKDLADSLLRIAFKT